MPSNTPDTNRLSVSSMGLYCFVAVTCLLCFANRPLWHTDLWDHVNYGRYIRTAAVIPDAEPLIPASNGAPMTCTDWGSKVLMSLIIDCDPLGVPGLQFINAALIAAAMVAVGQTILLRCASLSLSIFGCVLFLIINWQQLLVIRPQLAGVVLFCVVLLLTSTRLFRTNWTLLCLPVLFTIWANLHGSFSMGLTLLGLTALGQFLDTFRRTRKLRSAIFAPRVKRLLAATTICALAVLLNPNGLQIYVDVLTIGGNPNIASMYEWKALSLEMKQGKAALGATLLLLVVLAASRRRLRFTDLLPLITFLGLAIWSSRMLNWYAPVCACVTGVYGASATARFTTFKMRPAASRGWKTGLMCCVLVACFAYSNLGHKLLFGRQTSESVLLSSATPIRATEILHLESDRCEGPAFVPAEWSGYVMHKTDSVQPMVNLHVHVLPVSLWNDYLRLLKGPSDWLEILDRYDINVAVVDRNRQGRLTSLFRKSARFSLIYEDQQAAIFCRRTDPQSDHPAMSTSDLQEAGR